MSKSAPCRTEPARGRGRAMMKDPYPNPGYGSNVRRIGIERFRIGLTYGTLRSVTAILVALPVRSSTFVNLLCSLIECVCGQLLLA